MHVVAQVVVSGSNAEQDPCFVSLQHFEFSFIVLVPVHSWYFVSSSWLRTDLCPVILEDLLFGSFPCCVCHLCAVPAISKMETLCHQRVLEVIARSACLSQCLCCSISSQVEVVAPDGGVCAGQDGDGLLQFESVSDRVPASVECRSLVVVAPWVDRIGHVSFRQLLHILCVFH